MRCCAVLLLLMGWITLPGIALGEEQKPAPPAGVPADGKLPHIQVDVKAKQVRVECNSCNVHQDVGLEFFCCEQGTNEYESVLSSRAKGLHVHLALLMIGLEPGEPVKWSESAKKWLPPHGPALTITCEWKKDNGELARVPAYRLMVSRKTRKEAQPLTWIFTGSKVMDDGKYAADAVGYLVSVLNNELTVIDISELASRDLESREWDRNSDLLPPVGTTIWMVIEPAGKKDRGSAPATTQSSSSAGNVHAAVIGSDVGTTVVEVDAAGQVKIDGMKVTVERVGEALGNRRFATKVQLVADPQAPADEVKKVVAAIQGAHVELVGDQSRAPGGIGISDVSIDEAKIKALRELWERKVAPHDKALREAAQAHYEVIEQMRREQQRLIDEADRIQRAIDELQKQYQEMTTPRPEAVEK
jgi:biopolymer transport protein ExbD